MRDVGDEGTNFCLHHPAAAFWYAEGLARRLANGTGTGIGSGFSHNGGITRRRACEHNKSREPGSNEPFVMQGHVDAVNYEVLVYSLCNLR